MSDPNGGPAGRPAGKKSGGLAWPLLLGLPLVALLAIGAVFLLGGERAPRSGGQNGSAEKPAQPAGNDGGSGDERASGGEKLGTPALGDEGAPVVMVEYSDYQ